VQNVSNLGSVTLTLSVSPNPATYLQNITLTATANPSNATGTVNFLDGQGSIGSAGLAGGIAAFTTTLNSGPHTLSATYGGDSNFNGASSNQIPETVNPIATSVTLTTAPNPSSQGQTVTLNATISPSGGTGTVTFLDGSATLGTVPVATSAATFNTAALSPGPHSLKASYSGNTNYAASTSATVAQTVQGTGGVGLTSLSPATAAAGGSAFTLTINGFGFSAGAAVLWNGAALPTNFVSSTQLTASVPAALIVSTGTAIVSVSSGGTTTSSLPFVVNPPLQPCSFSFSPPNSSFGSGGGSGNVAVTATRNDCSWTASSNANWITLPNPNMTGSATLAYNVSANSAATSRIGTITIGAQTFNVTQGGVTCTFSLPASSEDFGSDGGTGSVAVQAPPGCGWSAASNSPSISFAAPAGGSGNGSVTYTVAPNSSGSATTAVLTVANLPFTVTQAGAAAITRNAAVASVPRVAIEGRTETLGDLVLTCTGLFGAITADISLTLNVNVTNRLTQGITDALLTVNGGSPQNGQISGYNVLRWPAVSLAPSGGAAVVKISKVRADASLLAIPGSNQTTPITGRVALTTPAIVSVTGPSQTLAQAGPSLTFTKLQASPPAGGPQTIVPLVFQEVTPASFTATSTRFRMALSNVPSSVQVWAPIFPTEGQTRAQLYSADSTGAGGGPVNGAAMAGGLYQQLTISGGLATATWLVLAADSGQVETWTFPLLVVNAGTGDLNALQVSGTLAPVSDIGVASSSAPIPRFRDLSLPQKLVNLRISTSVKSITSSAPLSSAGLPQPAQSVSGPVVTLVSQVINDTSDPSQTATNVTIQNNLPTGLTLVTCSTSGGACGGSGNQVQVSAGNLAPGGTATVTVVAQVTSLIPNGAVLDDITSVS